MLWQNQIFLTINFSFFKYKIKHILQNSFNTVVYSCLSPVIIFHTISAVLSILGLLSKLYGKWKQVPYDDSQHKQSLKSCTSADHMTIQKDFCACSEAT